jgi:hypothetical protein
MRISFGQDEYYTKRIKKNAHALTLASICWFPFAVAAGFGLGSERIADVVICVLLILIELLLLGLMIRAWRSEKPQEVKFAKGD